MRMVPDPRCGRKTKHDYAEVLLCLVIGFLVGRTSLRRSLRWCKRHLKWLRRYMALENGIASPSTACRILCNVDEYLFVLAFMEWIGEILSTKGIHLVIDGKALRAATEKVKGGRAPMLMNALDAATGLVLAQLPVQDKECEITAIPELLKLLDLRESTVTIDAIGTQTNIMKQIIEAEGHFVFTVKKNQPTAYGEIIQFFDDVTNDIKNIKKYPDYRPKYPEMLEKYEEINYFEKNHGRYEHRYYKICNDPFCLSRLEQEWTFIKSVGHVRQIRIPIERDIEGNDITPDLETFLKQGSVRRQKPIPGDEINRDIQDVGMISDLNMTAAEMGKIKRNHWTVENKLHHVLDDTFREDRSPARKSKNNLALIRKFTYNILKLAIMHYSENKTMPEMIDSFADDHSLIEEYIFSGIVSFY